MNMKIKIDIKEFESEWSNSENRNETQQVRFNIQSLFPKKMKVENESWGNLP